MSCLKDALEHFTIKSKQPVKRWLIIHSVDYHYMDKESWQKALPLYPISQVMHTLLNACVDRVISYSDDTALAQLVQSVQSDIRLPILQILTHSDIVGGGFIHDLASIIVSYTISESKVYTYAKLKKKNILNHLLLEGGGCKQMVIFDATYGLWYGDQRTPVASLFHDGPQCDIGSVIIEDKCLTIQPARIRAALDYIVVPDFGRWTNENQLHFLDHLLQVYTNVERIGTSQTHLLIHLCKKQNTNILVPAFVTDKIEKIVVLGFDR